MRASEIVGGLSVVGVLALIGFAIADEAGSGAVTAPTAPTILAPIDSVASDTTAAPESTTSAPVEAQPAVTEPESDSTEPQETSATTTPSSTTTTTPTTTTVPQLPVEERQGVRVRVVNGGAVVGGAQFVTGVLEGEGFAPVGPRDALTQVPQTTVFFAPGQEIAASTVGAIVAAGGDFVLAGADDPNWNEFGSELDVLVVLGPT